MDSLSVLIVSPEIAPLAQTGGLAEVAGSLPLALRDAGCQVAVSIPGYRRVLDARDDWEVAAAELPVRVGPMHLSARVLRSEFAPDIPVFAVQRDEFFDRSQLYGGVQGDYFDNPERFIFFSRALIAMCPTVNFIPDVIMGNDWQTGLVMALLNLGAMPRTAGVFCVHNMGFLGLVPPDRTGNIGLPDRYYGMEGLEYFGQMSLLKSGIVFSNMVTTVSPTYAREIQTPEGGHGLDGVMRSVSHRLRGILNGVDYNIWNPETDTNIPANFSPSDISGKKACKKALLTEMGLPDDMMDKPLAGIVSRLSPQKGLGLLVEAAEDFFRLGLGLVILGEGENVGMIEELKARYPDRVGFKKGFDASLSHRIFAGCDLLLMPSMFEPCGLAQMFALKYGTVPVVRAVGGLNDTILDPNGGNGGETGFKFGSFQAKAFVRAARRAVEAYNAPEVWRNIMAAGMSEDFSWNRSAGEYIEVFRSAVEARRGR